MNPVSLVPLAVVDPGAIVGVIAVFLIFGGGGLVKHIVDSMSRTKIELAHLRAQQQTSNTGSERELETVRAEIAALRQQMMELRDTTTQYDLSFDTALHRLERRMEQIEQQRIQNLTS